MRGALRMAAMAVAAVVAMTGGSMTVANAQSPAVSVAVPAPGGGGGYAGCWYVTHTIYGPYNLSYCLNRNRGGSYQVTGGGLNCNGGLDWYDKGNGKIAIDLYRAPCGRGTDWTGDSLSCLGANANLGVAVPTPAFNKMSCTYRPVQPGYATIGVTARRN